MFIAGEKYSNTMLREYANLLIEYADGLYCHEENNIHLGLCWFTENKFIERGIDRRTAEKYTYNLWSKFAFGCFGNYIANICSSFESTDCGDGYTIQRVEVARKIGEELLSILDYQKD